MLINLHIENFLIIEKTIIDFAEGLNVITGETGAGKSMIFDAIGLILGDKGGKDLIRSGADKSFLQASFLSDQQQIQAILREEGFEEDDLIIISRDSYLSGKSIYKVNGRVVNSSFVRLLGQHLINLSGQHEHQILMETSAHRRMIDQFGDEKHKNCLEQVKTLYLAYNEMEDKLSEYQMSQSEWLQKTDFLAYQIDEIEKSKLKDGEEESLDETYATLKHFEAVQSSVVQVLSLTREERGAMSLISKAKRQLSEVAIYNKQLESPLNQLETAFYTVEAATDELRNMLDDMTYDEGALEAVEQRLSLINDMKRKYGKTTVEILEQLSRFKDEYNQLLHYDENKQKIESKLEAIKNDYISAARLLSDSRKTHAEAFETAMMVHLADLNFNQCQFKAVFVEEEGILAEGVDKIEFYLSTNPGEPMRPLRKIASGGELSRIMLAAKLVSHKDDFPSTQIFDEIDSGISGRTANAVASKLKTISKDGQVILVTHLPQIAVAGDHHLLIEKQVQGGQTKVVIEPLILENRVSEIARMIGSGNITDLTLASAREMLTSTTS